jgi:hypothetical protein
MSSLSWSLAHNRHFHFCTQLRILNMIWLGSKINSPAIVLLFLTFQSALLFLKFSSYSMLW